jgi:alpha-glucosidase
MTERSQVQPWWTTAVGYEVYIRSFADSNGDGIGDLAGLTSRLHHLADLGIDAVWISPFYPSPMADFGYDVADYCDIDPQFGTLEDFDAMAAAAHQLGMKVIIDLVPNHSSDQHEWFVDSRSSRSAERRDWYHWHDPAPDGGPPNNWVSHFGGPAWTLDEATGQYYLHLFLPEQPDLNWANPAVVAAFDEVLTFWLDRGVDGFRIDVAHGMAKDPSFADNPQVADIEPSMGPRDRFEAFDHAFDMNQPGVFDIYRRWRALADSYGALLLGEVYIRGGGASQVAAYAAGDDRLHQAFYFEPMHLEWNAAELWRVFADAVQCAPNGELGWAVSSHDDSRAPSRFGGGRVGVERSLAFTALLLSLPGMPFLYQGSELGMHDVEVPPERMADPVAVRNDNPSDGRDPVRTPMPWDTGQPGFGFTTAADAWLPFGDHRDDDTVEGQTGDPFSSLERHRRLLSVRRELPDLTSSDLEWLTAAPAPLLAFRRGQTVVAVNVGDVNAKVGLTGGPWAVRYSTLTERTGMWFDSEIDVAPNEAVICTPNR